MTSIQNRDGVKVLELGELSPVALFAAPAAKIRVRF